jgi:hypothetical protein
MKKASLCFLLLLFCLNAHAAQVNLEVSTNPGYADNTTTIQNDDVRITMEQNAAKQQNMNSELYGWLDQSLKTTATPYFTGLSLKGSLHLQGTTAPYRVSLFAGTPTANRLWRLPIEAPPTSGNIKNISVNSSGQWILTDPISSGVNTFGELTDIDKTGWQEGRTVKFNSDGDLVVGDDQIGAPGDGDITGVTAGEGLTGGGLVGDVPIAVSPSILDRITANDAKVGVTVEEQNVNADWTASSGDAQILNKPPLGTAASRAAESVLTDGVNLPTGSAIKTYSDARYVLQAAAGTASGKDFEDTLTDGSNLPTGAAIKAYGDENWLESGSGDGLTSQPTTTMQYLKSTGADAYEWAEVDFYTQTEIGDQLASYYTSTEVDLLTTPSATVSKLAGQDVSVKSVNIPQTTTPQVVYMKPGSGSGGVGWAAPEVSSSSYVMIPPANPPSAGQLMSFTSAGTKDYGNGLSLATYQGKYVNPATGSSGGTLEITEVTTDPDPGTLEPGQMVASVASGNIFYKSSTGTYTGAFSYVVDDDYPLILSATVPSTGDKLIVTYNQDMVDGTELGIWAIECDLSGSLSLTAPSGTTTSAYTYPVSGGLIQKDDTCLLYYAKPTDGVEAEDDGVKLQSFSEKAIANNSAYVEEIVDGTVFHLDFNGTETEDLAGGWTKIQPTGTLTLDSTAYGPPEGPQAMFARNNAAGINGIQSPTFGPYSTLYYRYAVQTTSTGSSFPHGISFFSDTTKLGDVNANGSYRATNGTGSVTTIAVVAGNQYWVCGKFSTGSGADGEHIINIGTSADYFNNTTYELTTGDATGTVNNVTLSQYSSNGMELDDFTLSTEVITECGNM